MLNFFCHDPQMLKPCRDTMNSSQNYSRKRKNKTTREFTPSIFRINGRRKKAKTKKAIIVGKYITTILLFFSVPFLTLYKGRKKFNDTWMYHTSTDNDLSERKLQQPMVRKRHGKYQTIFNFATFSLSIIFCQKSWRQPQNNFIIN